MTLRSQVWGLGNDTQRGVCRAPLLGIHQCLFSHCTPSHISLPGNPVWGSEGKREKLLFLGMILPQSLWGLSHFPLTVSVLPFQALVCSASRTVALSWQPFLRLLLSLSWQIAGNAPIFAPLPSSLALGPLLANDGQAWECEGPPLCLRLGLL